MTDRWQIGGIGFVVGMLAGALATWCCTRPSQSGRFVALKPAETRSHTASLGNSRPDGQQNKSQPTAIVPGESLERSNILSRVAELEGNLATSRTELKKLRNERIAQTTFTMAVLESLVKGGGEEQAGQTNRWALEELGVFAGDFNRRAYEFDQKYAAGPPPDGTPESEAYKGGLAEFAREVSEALPKFPTDKSNLSTAERWPELTRMQTSSLASALELDDYQIQRVFDAYSRYYQQAARQSLFMDSKPATGVESWQQQRDELRSQLSTELSALMTESQKSLFLKLYPDPMWSVTIRMPGGDAN